MISSLNKSEETNGLVFQLNEKNTLLSIVENTFILRSIISQSNEYIVTSIYDSLSHIILVYR